MSALVIDLPNRDLAYLPQGTPEFCVPRELNWAQRFAMENRAEMMDRFAMVFADWVEALQGDVSDFIESTVNTHHNYTVKEKHGGRDVWLTRKGAIDAHDGRLGIIPGSMGPRSYIVRGKGNPKGLCSAPHGAGRRFSRAEARRRFTANDLADRMQGIEYRHGDEWVDEIPDAYKDIDTVMADAADRWRSCTSCGRCSTSRARRRRTRRCGRYAARTIEICHTPGLASEHGTQDREHHV